MLIACDYFLMEQSTSYKEFKHIKGKVETIRWIKGHGHVFAFKVLILFEIPLWSWNLCQVPNIKAEKVKLVKLLTTREEQWEWVEVFTKIQAQQPGR